MTIDISTAILLLVGIVGITVVQELVKVFVARMRSEDYVSKRDCEKCQNLDRDTDRRAEVRIQATADKVDAIARLVLAMAIKMGVDTKDIQKLM